MIRLTVEVLPYGSAQAKRLRGVMTIHNDGTGTKYRGNYVWKLWKSRQDLPPKTGTIKGFHRRSKGVWDLALLALTAWRRDRGDVEEYNGLLEETTEGE